jgi:DNA-binding XRE family transcriptional regulator
VQNISIKLWSSKEIRALREAKRMTIEEFAAKLGVSERMIYRWEGDNVIPRSVNQRALDTALSRCQPSEIARFADSIGPTSLSDQVIAETSVSGVVGENEDFSPLADHKPAAFHAELPFKISAPTFTGKLDADQPHSSLYPTEDVVDVLRRVHRLNRSVDPDIVRSLANRTQEIIDGYDRRSHSELAPILVKQRHWIDTLIDDSNNSVQRNQLLELAGKTSGLLGYISVGSGKFTLARAYLSEAFKLGHHAQEADLQSWTRGLQSFCEYYAQDYETALRLAVDGLALSNSGPQSVRLAINGVARALGKLGDADGVHRAVDKAYDLMARNDVPHGIPASIGFQCYSSAQVASNAATAYVSLGMPEQVQKYVRIAMPDIDSSESPWSRSLVMIDLATSFVAARQPDLDQASELMIDALTISTDRPIISIRQRTLDFVHHTQQRWGNPRQLDRIRDAISTGDVA